MIESALMMSPVVGTLILLLIGIYWDSVNMRKFHRDEHEHNMRYQRAINKTKKEEV